MEPGIKQSVPMTEDYPYGYENYESLGVARSASDTNNTTRKQDATTLLPDSKETFSLGPHLMLKSPTCLLESFH